jgi:DNA end-binding protein Ku
VEQKVAGKEVVVSAEAPRAQIIDLFEALKKSLAEAQEGNARGQIAVGAGSAFAAADQAPVTRPVKKAAPRKAEGKKKSVG